MFWNVPTTESCPYPTYSVGLILYSPSYGQSAILNQRTLTPSLLNTSTKLYQDIKTSHSSYFKSCNTSGSFGHPCKEENAIHILTPKLSVPAVHLFQCPLSPLPPSVWLREREESSVVFEFSTFQYSLHLCNLALMQAFTSLPNVNFYFSFLRTFTECLV